MNETLLETKRMCQSSSLDPMYIPCRLGKSGVILGWFSSQDTQPRKYLASNLGSVIATLNLGRNGRASKLLAQKLASLKRRSDDRHCWVHDGCKPWDRSPTPKSCPVWSLRCRALSETAKFFATNSLVRSCATVIIGDVKNLVDWAVNATPPLQPGGYRFFHSIARGYPSHKPCSIWTKMPKCLQT